MSSVAESLNRAIEYHQSGELGKAEEIYRDVIRHDPHHADALHLLGLAAHQQNRVGSAVDYITRAIQENDQFAPYHSNLGVTYLQMGKKNEAMECFQKALELEPDFPDATFNLGTLYFNEENFQSALTCFEKGLEQLPQDEKTWMKIGAIHQKTGDMTKAAECYRKILCWNPECEEAQEKLSDIERKIAAVSDRQTGVQAKEMELESQSTHSIDELIAQAAIHADDGNLNEAVACYKQVLRFDSLNAEALIGLGKMLIQMGNEVKAVSRTTTENTTTSLESTVKTTECPTFEEVREHIVGVIDATPTCHKPFPHVYFNNIFPSEFFMQMREHIPPLEYFEDLIHPEAIKPDGTSTRKMFKLVDFEIEKLPTKLREFWKTYAPLFTSSEMANSVFSHFTPPGRTLPSACLFKDMAGYKILPHPDLLEKQVTMQFYLPEDATKKHLGTRLYVNDGIENDDFREVRQFAFVPNTGYAFEISPTSWHAVEEIAEEDAPRDSLMVVYHNPQKIRPQKSSY